jgi:CheY-like chemotaxis protein
VEAVGNGNEAMARAATSNDVWHLLLTDVVMPHMGGRELADRLIAERRVRAVLYISGYTANSIVHHGVLDKAVAFLPKPFTSDQLLRAVRATIDESLAKMG